MVGGGEGGGGEGGGGLGGGGEGGGGEGGGDGGGGVGGRVGGGGRLRSPQSAQSVPRAHAEKREPRPPSSQWPSSA